MKKLMRHQELCWGLVVGAQNFKCVKIVIFVNQHHVGLEGGAEDLICAKIIMYTFKECCCGVGVLSTQCLSSLVFMAMFTCFTKHSCVSCSTITDKAIHSIHTVSAIETWIGLAVINHCIIYTQIMYHITSDMKYT